MAYWLATGIGLTVAWSFKELYTLYLRKDSPTSHIGIFEDIKKRHPIVCCHRGGASVFGPENTLHSYRRAVHEHKVDLLEIDVRVSRDGQLLILHDDTLDRTTNGTGRVEDYTLEELKKFDAAVNYDELRGKGITIPTLHEVLDEFSSVEGLLFFFDFKSSAAIPGAIEAVKSRGLERRVMMGAVAPKINLALQNARPDGIPIAVDYLTAVKIVLLYWTGLLWIYPFKHEIFGMFLVPKTDGILTRGFINHLHKRGRQVALFGNLLDFQEFQEKYFERGCDLLLSDQPDVLKKCVDKIKKNNSSESIFN